MEFTARHLDPVTAKTDCLILSIGQQLDAAAKAVDDATQGLVSRLLRDNDFSGKPGATLLLHEPPGLAARRLLLVGSGTLPMTPLDYIKTVRAAGQHVGAATKTVVTTLADTPVLDRNVLWNAQQLVRLFGEASYRFAREGSDAAAAPRGAKAGAAKAGSTKTDAARADNAENGDASAQPTKLKRVTLACADPDVTADAQKGITYGSALALGINRARQLGDLPANTCTPGYLAQQARHLGRQHAAVTTRVLAEKDMRELGMGALLSVTAGTVQPAYLLVMDYRGGKKSTRPVVLVGKGVTFDSGGISLKPGAKMDEMKYDMCGAASVLGVMEALAALQLPLNVIGIVPTVENMPSGQATKPGDVVTSLSGQTIEILNTDAEGRLILCDALTYAARYKPDTVIDIATLTGACVVALGKHASGLFSNDEALAADLLAAGEQAGDRAWQLPLWDDYDQQLKSPFADIANIGGPEAGSITAACFLARFTKSYRWAHLDIAGSAWNSAGPKGATGRPVPLLLEYLRRKAGEANTGGDG